MSPPRSPDAPEGVVAAMQGTLVIRLSYHPTEAGNEYPLRVTVVEEDGREIANIQADVTAQTADDAPRTWTQGVNVILPLSGLPLPRFGEYRINVYLNREHKGDLPFRVAKRY